MTTNIEGWSQKTQRLKEWTDNAKRARELSKREEFGEGLEKSGWKIIDRSQEDQPPEWIVYKLGEPLENGDPNIAARAVINPDSVISMMEERQRPEHKGFWGEWKKDAARAVENTTSGILGGIGRLSQAILRTPAMRILPIDVPLIKADKAVQDSVVEWGDLLYEDAQSWSLAPAKDKTPADFVRRSVISVFPYTAAAAAAGLFAGPAGAFAVSALIEGDASRRNALEKGASDRTADLEGLVVGVANGSIQLLQVGQIFKFARGFDDVGKQMLVEGTRQRMLTKLAQRGGQYTYQAVKLSTAEALEETAQEAVSIGLVKMHGEDIDFYDALERLKQAATGAAVVSPILGAPGIIVNRRLSNTNRHEPFDPRYDTIDAVMMDIRNMASTQLIGNGTFEAESLPKSVRQSRAEYGIDRPLIETPVPGDLKTGKPGLSPKQAAAQYKEDLGGGPVSFAEKYAAIKKRFKSPEGLATALRYITPKWLINRKEGIEYVAQDVENARLWTDIFTDALSGLTNRAMKYYTAQAKKGDKFFSWLVKKPTDPIAKLFDHLDSYEYAPKEWSQQDQKAFNELRRLSQGLREMANAGRRKAGLPEIQNVREYITHWYDSMASHVQNNNYPMQFGYIWRLAKKYATASKAKANPTAFHRKVVKELEQHFNKNVPELLKAMIAYDVRDALLTNPYEAARAELKRLEETGEAPHDVREDFAKYLTYDISRQATRLDEVVDSVMTPLTKVANIALAPFGREIESPARSMSSMVRRIAYISALGFRAKPALRNLGQRLLLTDLYNYRDVFTAQAHQADGFWPSVEAETGEIAQLDDWLKTKAWYLTTGRYMSEANSVLEGVIGKAATEAYHATHMSNVGIAARTGYYDWLRRYQLSQDQSSSYYKAVEKRVINDLRKAAHQELKSRKIKDTSGFVARFIKEALPGEMKRALVQKEDMEGMTRDAVRFTQWEYFPTSMPMLYRGNTAKALLIFQSWIQNYYSSHIAEVANQTFHGRDSRGKVVFGARRFQGLRGMGIMLAAGRAAETVFGIEILKFLLFPRPDEAPPENIPAGQLAAALWRSAFSEDEYEKKRAINDMRSVLELGIPGKKALDDFIAAHEKESIRPLLFYEKKEKK